MNKPLIALKALADYIAAKIGDKVNKGQDTSEEEADLLKTADLIVKGEKKCT